MAKFEPVAADFKFMDANAVVTTGSSLSLDEADDAEFLEFRLELVVGVLAPDAAVLVAVVTADLVGVESRLLLVDLLSIIEADTLRSKSTPISKTFFSII